LIKGQKILEEKLQEESRIQEEKRRKIEEQREIEIKARQKKNNDEDERRWNLVNKIFFSFGNNKKVPAKYLEMVKTSKLREQILKVTVEGKLDVLKQLVGNKGGNYFFSISLDEHLQVIIFHQCPN
jgi:hypothetical protein